MKPQESSTEYITSADGTTIAYHTKGAGRPVLLVHGTTADHTRWAGVAPQLERRFRVCTMDRRGRGESGDGADYSLMREAEDIAAFVDAIGEPASIVAHSYGAVCALEAALLTTGIKMMVLYEPPIPTGLPMYPPGVPDRMQKLIDDQNLEAALTVFFHEVVGMPEPAFSEYRSLPTWPGRVRLAPTIPRELSIDRGYTFDPDRFAEVSFPVLLLLGGDSPPLFKDATQAVHAALANSSVSVLPGQQHIAMDTNPELFVSEVLKFLAG